MTHDYFDTKQWTETTFTHIRRAGLSKRVTGVDLLVPPAREVVSRSSLDALGLVSNDDDWLILTNRISELARSTRFHFEFSGNSVTLVRHPGAVDAAIRGKLRLGDQSIVDQSQIARELNYEEIARETGTHEADVSCAAPGLILEEASRRDYEKRCSWAAKLRFEPPPAAKDDVLPPLYERGESLGSGATGQVYRASLTRSTTWGPKGTDVAVKLIDGPALARLNGGDQPGRERLLREFRVGRSHNSRRLARTYDVFCMVVHDPRFADYTDHYGVAIELIRGVSLDSVIPSDKRPALALSLAMSVRDLHGKGFVHRDVKPANAIWKDGEVFVVLVDYGITKSPNDATVTETKDQLFTRRYAPTEQLRDPSLEDQSLDIYALGVSIWEILTGQKAFKTDEELAMKETSPMTINPLSGDIGALLSEMVSIEPENRPTIREVCERLGRLVG